MLLFVTVVLGVLGGVHAYLAARLIFAPELPAVTERALLGGLALLGSTLILQPIAERRFGPPWSRLLSWPASVWMGLMFLAFVLVGATDLLLLPLAPHNLTPGAGGDPGRTHQELMRGRAAFVAVATVVAGGIALRSGLGAPAVKQVHVELENWPGALDGFRIVQISDIHIGPVLDRRFSRHLTERCNGLDPDVVAITGDLVDGGVDPLRDEVAPFAGLRARHGVYFVTGNHDHYSGANAWCRAIEELGIQVLRNRHVTIERDGAAFALAGVDDHHGGLDRHPTEDLRRALAGARDGAPVVLLAHDPGTFPAAAAHDVDLQISGHTHGGQIWPFNFLVRLSTPFVAGLYRLADAQIYVSRGTGFWGPPMRLGAPAEITEITIRGPNRPSRASAHSPE